MSEGWRLQFLRTSQDDADTEINFATAGLYEITHFFTLGLDEVIYKAIMTLSLNLMKMIL